MRAIGRAGLLLLLLLAVPLACTPRFQPRSDPGQPSGRVEDRREGVVHRVEAGETWSDIARDYYDDAGSAKRLRGANPALGAELAAGDEVFVPLSARERQQFAQRAGARAPYNLGLAYARAGDYPEAIIQFREALRQDEKFAPAQYNLGLVYRRAGQNELATEALALAVRLDASRADYHYALGLSYLDGGEAADAAASFRAALGRDDGHLATIFALAKLYDEKGRPGLALDLWRRYLALDPGSARGAEARRRVEGAR